MSDDYLAALAPVLLDLGQVAPLKGRIVQTRDKKHFGKIGRVFYHGRDRFSKSERYGDSAVQHLRECGGRCGYRIGIETREGEKFFISAAAVLVCVEGNAS